MSDKTLTIATFKYGLDARRQDLSSSPGTLVQCINGHINSGGEIEKRKAFVPSLVTFPTNTFGIQDTDTGIMTFGSDAGPNSALPGGVVYTRLVSPTLSAMTAVVDSKNYNGKAFVLAKFATGETVAFYNGVAVADSWNGKVFTSRNGLVILATDLANQIGALTGWTATPNIDPNGNPLFGSVMAKSPPGITFTPTILKNSLAGLLGAQNTNDTQLQLSGSQNTASICAFLVTNIGGSFTISAPSTPTGGPLWVICPTLVGIGSPATTGTAIANEINATSILYGYTASSDGAGNVFVVAPAAWGAAVNGQALTVVLTSAAAIDAAVVKVELQVNITPNPVFDRGVAHNGGLFSIDATAQIIGGYPPFLVAWSEPFVGSGNGILLTTTATGATSYYQAGQTNVALFSMSLLGPVTVVTGQFQVVVTDSHPVTPVSQTIFFPVTLYNG